MEVLREQTLFFMGLCNINSYIRIYLVMIHDDVPKKSEFEFPEPDGNVPKLKDLLEDVGMPWGTNREPGNALGDLLGNLGDALEDQPGAWERLEGSPGRPW